MHFILNVFAKTVRGMGTIMFIVLKKQSWTCIDCTDYNWNDYNNIVYAAKGIIIIIVVLYLLTMPAAVSFLLISMVGRNYVS